MKILIFRVRHSGSFCFKAWARIHHRTKNTQDCFGGPSTVYKKNNPINCYSCIKSYFRVFKAIFGIMGTYTQGGLMFMLRQRSENYLGCINKSSGIFIQPVVRSFVTQMNTSQHGSMINESWFSFAAVISCNIKCFCWNVCNVR